MKPDTPARATALAGVPIGEAHSKTSRQIWATVDQWAPITIRNCLYHLAKDGVIQSKMVPTPHGETRVFWRETEACT